MKKYVFGAFIALGAALGSTAPLAAQTVEGDGSSNSTGARDTDRRTYIAGTVGYAMPKDLQSSVGVRADLTSGVAGTVAIGRSYGPIRAEIEGGYRDSRVEGASGFGLDVAGAGKVSAWSAMANVYFDPSFSIGPVTPYIGAGLGAARFRARNVSAVGLPAGLPATSIGPVSGSETGFAYQAMAGLAVPFGRSGAITIGYRYFGTPNVDVDAPAIGQVTIRGLRVHSVDAGVRLAF